MVGGNVSEQPGPTEGQPVAVNRVQSGVFFSSVGYLLQKSGQVTSLSFETAKSCTKLGLGVTKEIISTIGSATGLELPLKVVRSAVECAEWIALTSVETGRFWVDFGLGAGRHTVEILSVVFGSSDIAASIVEFSELVSRENLLHDAEAEGDISFPELLRGISAWVYLQNRTQGLYRQLMWKDPVMVPLVRESQSEHALFSKLKRFVKFGSAAYGDFGHSFLSRKIPHISTDTWLAPRNHHSFASHTNNSVSSIYHSSDSLFKDSNVYSPKFYVVVDEESNNIVLTFRGTLGFHDLLVDLTCENEQIEVAGEPSTVHQGMWRAAKNIANPDHKSSIFNAVNSALLEYPNYGLTLVGHSLGAAVASALSTLWGDAETGTTSPSSGLPGGRPFQCFAFGAVCVFGMNGSKKLSKLVTSVVTEEDIVSGLSLGSCRDLAAAARWMNRNRVFADKLLPQMFGGAQVRNESLDQGFLAQRLLIEGQYMNSPAKLYPAGQVVFIDEEGSPHVVRRLDVVFSHLYLGRGIENHLPHTYEARIQGL